ncbi:MAG: hypothetical protein ACREOZ_03980, partial [Gloeomargaritales cyanobacterium]
VQITAAPSSRAKRCECFTHTAASKHNSRCCIQPSEARRSIHSLLLSEAKRTEPCKRRPSEARPLSLHPGLGVRLLLPG